MKMLRPVPDLVGAATVMVPAYSGRIRSSQLSGMGRPFSAISLVFTAMAMTVALWPM